MEIKTARKGRPTNRYRRATNLETSDVIDQAAAFT